MNGITARIVSTAIALLVAGTTVACGGESDSGSLSDAYRGGGSDTTGRSGGSAAAPETEVIDLDALGHVEGAEDAPIQVVEFSDFGCPHCRAFHIGTYPAVHERWVEGGQVRWQYIPFALGNFPNSVPATRAGECAIEQEAFPAYRDRLFESQEEWIYAENAVDLFVRYAEEEGLDADRLRTCVEERWREDEVLQSLQLARRIQVRGTPTFLIAGQRIQGNQPPEFFHRMFEQMLEQLEGPESVPGTGSD